MKRQFFTGLKAFAVSAIALGAVSCYDDTDLWNELESQAGDIATLEQRVAALEDKLNTEVATLNGVLSTLDGKVKELTEADKTLLDKLAALNSDLEGAEKEVKAAVESINDLTTKLDGVDGAVDGVVADLEAAVEALDAADGELDGKLNKLEGDLKGLSTTVATEVAKIAVVRVDKNEAGNHVLTFVDGSTLEVAAAANTNNTGLVTIVDGKWAVVGDDGEVEVLDVAVDPKSDIKFKVEPATFEVFVSLNGGEFEGTGVYVKDSQTINVVTAVTETKDFVTITVGDVEYRLPHYVPDNSAFEIMAGRMSFQSQETKAFRIEVADIKSSFVVRAPKGWTIEVEGDILNVTAPEYTVTEEWDDIMEEYKIVYECEGDLNGLIEIWAATLDGKVHVGTLKVTVATLPYTVEVNEVTYDVTITVDENASEYFYHPMAGQYSYWPSATVYYGACLAAEFNAEALYSAIMEESDEIASTCLNRNTYDFVTLVETSLAELLGFEPVEGETYVVWSYSKTQKAGYNEFWEWEVEDLSTADDFAKNFVTLIGADVTATSAAVDVELDIKLKGTNKFFAGYMYASNFNPETFDIQEYLNSSPMMAISLGLNWGIIEGDFHGTLSELAADYEILLHPACEFKLFVLPLDQHSETTDQYVNDQVKFYDVCTSPLVSGGAANTTLDLTDIRYDAMYPIIESDAERVYTYMYDVEEYENDLGGVPSVVLADVLGKVRAGEDGSGLWNEFPHQLSLSNLTPGTEKYLVLVSFDYEGKYSLVVEKIATKSYPVAEESVLSLVVDQENSMTAAKSVTLKLNITGSYEGLMFSYYENPKYEGDDAEQRFADNRAAQLAKFEIKAANGYPANITSGITYVKAADVVDGFYTLQGLSLDKNYCIQVIAYNAEGKFTKAQAVDFTTSLSDDFVVLNDSDDYITLPVGLDANMDGVIDGYTYYNVNKGQACFAVNAGDNQNVSEVLFYAPYYGALYEEGVRKTGKDLVVALLKSAPRSWSHKVDNSYIAKFEQNKSYVGGTNEQFGVIMVVDKDGRYHEPVVLSMATVQHALYNATTQADITLSLVSNPSSPWNPMHYKTAAITLSEESTFYFRSKGSDDVKFGLAADATLATDGTKASTAADGASFTLPAGKYEVYFDLALQQMWVLTK